VVIAGAGTGWVFLANALSYAAVLGGLLAMRTADLHPVQRLARGAGQLREGLAYVRSRPDLLVPMVLVAVVGMFGLNFQLTLALVSKQVFQRDASGYGLLLVMLAIGSLLGALASARRTGPPRQRRLFVAALVFAGLEVAVALAPTFAVMAVLLVPTGAAILTFTTTANAIVQLGSAPQVRGRVMALYVLVFLGGTPIGAPIIGLVAETYGPRSSLVVGGLVCALTAVGGAWWLGRTRGLTYAAHLRRRRPHLHVYVQEQLVEQQVESVID
jgi:predicted MFS family arabinose efflux permease